MKVCCISDLHSKINFSIDPCDLLIIAGDVCPAVWNRNMNCIVQERWLIDFFIPWLNKQDTKEVVFIAGNHDWIWDLAPTMVPEMPSNFHYLCDNFIEIMGLKIYGTPQQKYFNDWAFNRTNTQLEKYYANIPEGLDILLTHIPPFKILDKVMEGDHQGCKVLLSRLKEMKNPPRYHIFGHIHEGYGITDIQNTKYINCSLMDGSYRMINKPVYIDIEILK